MTDDDEETDQLVSDELKRRLHALRDILSDVEANGFAVISKPKLLQLLLMKRLRAERWVDLQNEYAFIGGAPLDLRGRLLPNGQFLLTRFAMSKNPFADPD